MRTWRATYFAVLSWLRLPGGDWAHAAWGLFLTLATGLWWIGPVVGIVTEVLQFFVTDQREPELTDRLCDIWGHGAGAVTLAAWWLILPWYALLLGARKAGW